MNPPSALYGAMNKERKPFTYTPGGLDLSQIKSERMAQRLMRNAMDQGVPEQPTQHLQSPPTPTALNVPNFNCLPVQVFPTFPLPSNPKSLLKNRSNSQKEPCLQDLSNLEQFKTNVNQSGLKQCFENNNKDISNYNQPNNENKNNDLYLPLYEYTPPIVRSYPSYEANDFTNASSSKNNICIEKELSSREDIQQKYTDEFLNSKNNKSFEYEPSVTSSLDTSQKPLLTSSYTMEQNIPETFDEMSGTETNQNEIKVVKKQVKAENNTEAQNGDANVEAAVTVKLPGKKSSAKTETNVEVVKNIRPDGSTEEVKTTTTKTTIDGKTEITTKTETTIIPKEEEYEEEEVVEEEEEEEEEQDNAAVEEIVATNEDQENKTENISEVAEDTEQEQKENLNSQETSETKIIKQVTVTESAQDEDISEEEIEEEEEEEEKEDEIENKNQESQVENIITDNKEELEEDADDEDEGKEKDDSQNEDVEEVEEKVQVQEHQELKTEKEDEVKESTNVDTTECNEIETRSEETIKTEDEKEKESIDDSKSEVTLNETADSEPRDKQSENSTLEHKDTKSPNENKEEIVIEVQVLKPSVLETENSRNENDVKTLLPSDRNIPFREPSAPLEKVEDVEIKPIGEIISKTRTENTEIITTSLDKPITGLSTQTAYNRIENIVTVNKTTKTLDHAFDQHAPIGIPTVKTYFAPTTDRLSTSPYQPVYTPEPQPERRHSLLLDRLSVDRQMPPAEIYQSNYQTYEQNQWTQEPQSEVLTVSNVKPSTITKNQQWYQQTRKDEVSYDTAPVTNAPIQDWSTPTTQQRQTPQPSQTQYQYQPQPQPQPSYIDKQDTYSSTLNNSSTYQQSSYQPSYTPKPTSWVGNNVNLPKTVPTINKPASQYSYVNKEPTETYQTPPQPYSSSYIPPPWEQDPNYVPENLNTTYYTPPPSNKFTSSASPAWAPKPTSKFTKPKPTSYIPPAPNQSFVKPVSASDQPKLPGRKTYYSEYERRYISVPESTYIPTENKFQAQPDPSPQYYYDNNEPKETVEHEWRKELREFSEKSQSQTHTEQSSVKPPWEEDPKYYVPTVSTEYTPTPTWSQTLRPSSWRDRSFESEFGRAKELARTNTIGRGRPQSSYVKSNISTPIPERTRGVSVDRYNPNNYKSPVPSEYPPVQSHTLDPTVGAKTYHNPNIPAYHSRASAEPRESSAAFPQPRHYAEARAPPLQSRSFKYLQWITGTED